MKETEHGVFDLAIFSDLAHRRLLKILYFKRFLEANNKILVVDSHLYIGCEASQILYFIILMGFQTNGLKIMISQYHH